MEVDDPSSDHHLFWTEPPETVFVVKKIRDGDVTEKFKVVVKFLAEVSQTLCCYLLLCTWWPPCLCLISSHMFGFACTYVCT